MRKLRMALPSLLVGAVLITLATISAAVPLSEVRAGLWPKSPHDSGLMVAGAPSRALQAYGRDPQTRSILDVGALRQGANGQAEVLAGNGAWVPYVEAEHRFIANVFNRIGPGWSFGSNSTHNSARGWFETVHGRLPNAMESIDIQYSRALFEDLRRKATTGVTEPKPEPCPACPACPTCHTCQPCAPCVACPAVIACPDAVVYLSTRPPTDLEPVEFWDRATKTRHQGKRVGGVWYTAGGHFLDAHVYAWRPVSAPPEVR